MAHSRLERFKQQVHIPGFQSRIRQWARLPQVASVQGPLPLLLSTSLAEIAGNVVYVALLERTFDLGGGATNVGGVLIAQSVPQVFLGAWAGSLVDRVGKRKAAILATVASAALAVGLAMGRTILAVYVFAVLITLARLVLIPARLAFVPHIVGKEKLVRVNTVLAVLSGIGLFLGPAIGAALLSVSVGFKTPLIVAGLGLVLSAAPLLLIRTPTRHASALHRMSIWREMRSGWQFIRQHASIWKVLMCQVTLALVVGGFTPLITPLTRQLGLGTGGTGVLLAALGLGGLIGPWSAILFFKRLNLSVALLLSGLLAAVGLVLAGLLARLEGVFAALLLTALAAASLNVIVVTILQRLTPSDRQGYVFGVEQALLGIAWLASLSATTAGVSLGPEVVTTRGLFLLFGGSGFLLVLVCWFWYRSRVVFTGQIGETRFEALRFPCRAISAAHLPMSGAACRLICGSQCQCFNSVGDHPSW